MAALARALRAWRVPMRIAFVTRVRRSWWLSVRRPPNCFQPHSDTAPDRYPEVFTALRGLLEEQTHPRLLSFGCSVGDEITSLRSHFPAAEITGIDISAGNIRDCRRRFRRAGDERVLLRHAGDVAAEPNEHFDAALCMAVFRHGDLAVDRPPSCANLITFSAFERTVAGVARTVRVGGYLAIDHSNFRFSDTRASLSFEVVAVRPTTVDDLAGTPQYDRDDRPVADAPYREVIFRKCRRAAATGYSAPRAVIGGSSTRDGVHGAQSGQIAGAGLKRRE